MKPKEFVEGWQARQRREHREQYDHERASITASELKVRRERIATAALQGLLASDADDGHSVAFTAGDAVRIADALIEALDRPEAALAPLV
jgi:hypothetical protein